nr:helix-turn-helix transcriptional regulator [Micromonospora sp. DSM 115978]
MANPSDFRHLLRRLRTERGLSQDAVGAAVHVSGSQIGHYESGRSLPHDDMAGTLDDFLEARGELVSSAQRARGEAVAPWLRPWRDNEERAVLVRAFEHSVVPGLLQTEAYMRKIISAGPHTPDQIEEAVGIRLARQAATLQRPNPLELSVILGEAVLRHGESAILKEQLEYLVDIGHRPNVHIRVVPFAGGLHGGTGAFAIATLPNGTEVTYLDDLVEGKVADRLRDVSHAVIVWERLCVRALPCDMSRDLIMKAIDDHG